MFIPSTTRETATMNQFIERISVLEGERAMLLRALKALTNWARENTSPNDTNSPHTLLIDACAAIAKAEGVTVSPDPDQPGLWLWRDAAGNGSDTSFATKDEAQVNALLARQ
jgi:hypothetical protein